MKSFVFACILLGVAYAQGCGTPAVSPSRTTTFFDRIVGGTVAVKNSWPWQIHLGLKTTTFFGSSTTQFICGGSVISNKWVITAAHCVSDLTASKYVVRVGQHDTSLSESTKKDYKVKRIIRHASFSSSTLNNDVALLEIDGTIAFTNAVSAVCLPPTNSDPAEGTQCVATGWGEVNANGRQDFISWNPFDFEPNRASSRTLRQVNLNVVSRSKCNLGDYYGGVITSGMVCAGTTGKDSCQGDSGGPFVCKNSAGAYELTGVVSWGYGCGAAKKPGVYARVGNYISWIKSNTDL